MRIRIVLLALLLGGIVVPGWGLARAADLGVRTAPAYSRSHALPFPRSARATAVWGEGACWNDCQATCTWGQSACLVTDSQGLCVKYTDACDRMCQRDCRARGGPYLDPLFDELD